MKINITESIKISMRGYTIINVNAYWEENGRRYAVKACDGLKIDSNDKEVILRGSYDGRNVEWKLCDKGNYITAELTIQSKNEVYIDALCAFRGEIKPEEANQKFLKVPFDNDDWVKFESKEYSKSEMGYGVSAVYNQNGALIIGALEYDIWKTGIIPNECIEVRSGVTDKLTRDTIKHGTVHGEIVKSPVIYIGESRTWQQGMMGFADIYNEYNTRLLWHGPIPFGWNSWYAYMKEIDMDKYMEASKFVSKTNFYDKNVSYINFDAFWNVGLTSEELLKAAEFVKERGQIPGAYIAPFAGWIKEDCIDDYVTYDTGERVRVDGFEDIRYSDIILKDYNGRILPPLDGGYPLDVTHPVVIERLRYVIKYLGGLGYRYIKADFLGHAAVEGKHYIKEIQTGMAAYNYAMQKLKEYCIEEGMFISLSIAPLFPGGYGHSRRICCDVFQQFKDTEYLLNAVTYGFWQNKKVYEFTDPDHICFNGNYAEAKSRLVSALVGGTLMLMSNDVENEDINKRILDLTSNNELLDIAREHITFVPIDESIDRDFASVFISENKKYMTIFNMTDTDRKICTSAKGIKPKIGEDLFTKVKIDLSATDCYELRARDCTVLRIVE